MARANLILACMLALSTHAAPQKYSLEELLPRSRVQGLSFSPDESEVLLSSDAWGKGYKLRSISLLNGQAKAIATSGTEPAYAISFFPSDKRILFMQNTGFASRLRVLEPNGRERTLTEAGSGAEFVGWTRNGDGFYVLLLPAQAFSCELVRFGAASYEKNTLYSGPLRASFGAISSDAQWIGLQEIRSRSAVDISLLHLPSRSRQSLSQGNAASRGRIAGFDPLSQWLYYVTDEGEDFLRVRRHDLATGKQEEVERASCDIARTVFSRNGKYRASILDREGRNELKVYELATHKEIQLHDIPFGNITNLTISPSERLLAFHLETERSPFSLYICDLQTAAAKRLTRVVQPPKERDLVESEAVRFNSHDDLSIPCLLYKPHRATANRKAPALLWCHGGPASQLRAGYSTDIQHLVNRGFVVLGINYRGSTGYGKAFSEANAGENWGDPVLDCVEAKKYLASLPFVDANRIGIIGASYGGYLVLAALAFHPDVFKVGVTINGVSNWQRVVADADFISFAQSYVLHRLIGHPEKDAERLRAISPVFHAGKIQHPLFVLQGAKDKKVPKDETDKVVEIVKANGVPLEYVVLNDEGHNIEKKENLLNSWRKIVRFLETHL